MSVGWIVQNGRGCLEKAECEVEGLSVGANIEVEVGGVKAEWGSIFKVVGFNIRGGEETETWKGFASPASQHQTEPALACSCADDGRGRGCCGDRGRGHGGGRGVETGRCDLPRCF